VCSTPAFDRAAAEQPQRVLHPTLVGAQHSEPGRRGQPVRPSGELHGRDEHPLRAYEIARRVPSASTDNQAPCPHLRVLGKQLAILREPDGLLEASIEVRRPRADFQRCRARWRGPLHVLVSRRIPAAQSAHARPLQPGIGVRM